MNPQSAYLFRHAIYRDVAYGLQLPSARAELHRQALDAVRKVAGDDLGPVAADLARHARLGAEDTDPATAERLRRLELEYLTIAIEYAFERDRNEVVIECARRVLQNPYAAMAQRQGALYREFHSLATLGRFDESVAAGRKLAEFTRESDPEQAGVALTVMATHLSFRGRLDEAWQCITEAETLIPGHLKLHYARAILYSGVGENPQSLAEARKSWMAARKAGDVISANIAIGQMSSALTNRGEFEKSLRLLRRLAPRFLASGSQMLAGINAGNLGRQLMLLGRNDEALAEFRKAQDFNRRVGNRRSEAFALGSMAELQLKHGRIEETRESIDRALEIARDYGILSHHASFLCVRARLELLTGHEREAQELVEQARAELTTIGSAAYVPEYCDTIRLRIAASIATTEGVSGRGTTRLVAGPPDPRWVRVAVGIRGRIDELQEIRKRIDYDALAAVVTELESALTEQRPAMIFRGHLPDQIAPALRRELVARFEQRDPAGMKSLKTLHPALYKALTA